MKEYRIISICEPFATLLAYGIKKIETRPKPTSWTIEKGSYLIHAAKKFDKFQKELIFTEPFYSALKQIGNGMVYKGKILPAFTFGAIIGAIDVVGCKKIPHLVSESDREIYLCLYEPFQITWDEYSFGDYTAGRYAWITQNARLLETPIPYKGQQGYYSRFKGDINQLKFK
jgi:activating signal cointegrator 1